MRWAITGYALKITLLSCINILVDVYLNVINNLAKNIDVIVKIK